MKRCKVQRCAKSSEQLQVYRASRCRPLQAPNPDMCENAIGDLNLLRLVREDHNIRCMIASSILLRAVEEQRRYDSRNLGIDRCAPASGSTAFVATKWRNCSVLQFSWLQEACGSLVPEAWSIEEVVPPSCFCILSDQRVSKSRKQFARAKSAPSSWWEGQRKSDCWWIDLWRVVEVSCSPNCDTCACTVAARSSLKKRIPQQTPRGKLIQDSWYNNV